jgi:broad specificity phosphatase PhoE
MSTIVYLVRHSKPFKEHLGIVNGDSNVLIDNMRRPLSVDGEKMAKEFSTNYEFDNINEVWSSGYSRCLGTSKYFAYNNNLKVNIDDRLNERLHGVINSYNEVPDDYEEHQLYDENYKLPNGENQKEVGYRIYNALFDIISNNKNKKVIIVSHCTSIIFLLKKLGCNIILNGNYSFNGNVFFNGIPDYLETFKLEFDDNNELVNIENIR